MGAWGFMWGVYAIFCKLSSLMQKTASNRRCGQAHPRAVLTDHEVDLMRMLHEIEGWGYKRLAKKFEVPKRTVRDICNYRYR